MGDFEIDAVLYFMISKGGRVRNHELVTHFKNFLNHPNNKALNRDKFKDFVNELATIKLDGGEKVLVLKKKYRPLSDGGSGMTAPPPLSAPPPPKGAPLKKAVPAVRPEPEDNSTIKSSGSDDHHQSPQPQAPPRARSEPPAPENKSVTPQNEKAGDSSGVGGAGDLGKVPTKARSQELVEADARSHMQRSEDAISTTSSSLSLASTNSQESSASATSGISSLEGDTQASIVDMQRKQQQERQPLSKIEDNVSVDSNSATPTSSSAEDVANISVMDKIKKLNKIHSETDLHHPKHPARKNSKFLGGEEDDYHIALGPEEKEWMLVCSAAEYHEINRLLCKDASLAKLKDFTNGYTALHWAAKAGKPEIIKMIANRPGVNIDQRSHGGYTALHLAAIHGHEQIIELLVQTFKADANMRDYSGKKAKQYLKNSASSKAQQLLQSRRLGSSDVFNTKSMDDSFLRSASMRMSTRAKEMSSLLQTKTPVMRSSWAGSRGEFDEEDEDPKRLKTSHQSPSGLRHKKSMRDGDLMPPPPNAINSRWNRYSERSKSSSRESLNSPRIGRRAESTVNDIPRSGSDPNLLEGTIV